VLLEQRDTGTNGIDGATGTTGAKNTGINGVDEINGTTGGTRKEMLEQMNC
jgi:hypothetical protein